MTKFTNFARCSANSRKDKNGRVAEWLGKALQKLLQQFESVRYLKQKPHNEAFDVFVALCLQNFYQKKRALTQGALPVANQRLLMKFTHSIKKRLVGEIVL